MSSPMINNVVLLGCSFCYVFVFFLGIDSRFVDDHILGILCNVSLFCYVKPDHNCTGSASTLVKLNSSTEFYAIFRVFNWFYSTNKLQHITKRLYTSNT